MEARNFVLQRPSKEDVMPSNQIAYANAPNPVSTPIPPQPPVQAEFESLTIALSELRDQVSALDEKLGYVSLQPNAGESGETGPVEPERSPMAHNIHCATCDVNRLAYRLQEMRGRLQI
jgi:hypothetical protein